MSYNITQRLRLDIKKSVLIDIIFGAMVLLLTAGCTSKPALTATSMPTPTMVETEIVKVPPVAPWYEVYWEGKESAVSGMLILPDGGLLVVGSMQGNGKPKQIGGVMLFRTDEYGNPLWMEIYGGKGYDYGWDAAEAPDGGYVIVGTTTSYGNEGRNGYVFKVDEDGVLLWSKTYGEALNEGFNSITPSPNGEYFILGNVEDPKDIITDPGAAGYAGFAGRSNVYIVKLDKDGGLIWSRVIESDLNIISSDGLVSEEGDFYAIATVNKYPDKGDDLLLYKFDTNGEQVWVRIWEEGDMGGYAMAEDKEGNMVITGISHVEEGYGSEIFLLKVDKDGNELFNIEYGEANLYEIGQDVVPLIEGGYAILTLRTPSLFVSYSDISILVVDENGSFLWESKLEFEGNFRNIKASTILQYPDGGFVIAGNIITFHDQFHTLLFKTDAEGKIE